MHMHAITLFGPTLTRTSAKRASEVRVGWKAPSALQELLKTKSRLTSADPSGILPDRPVDCVAVNHTYSRSNRVYVAFASTNVTMLPDSILLPCLQRGNLLGLKVLKLRRH